MSPPPPLDSHMDWTELTNQINIDFDHTSKNETNENCINELLDIYEETN